MTLAEALIEYKIDKAISGAIYDLLGNLTTRDKDISVGGKSECTPVLDAFLTWAKNRNLDIEDADVAYWTNKLGSEIDSNDDAETPVMEPGDTATVTNVVDPDYNGTYHLSIPDDSGKVETEPESVPDDY